MKRTFIGFWVGGLIGAMVGALGGMLDCGSMLILMPSGPPFWALIGALAGSLAGAVLGALKRPPSRNTDASRLRASRSGR